MAEAIINARRGERWQAVSGGTKPADVPNPRALQALAEIGIITAGSTPTHMSAYYGQAFDLVLTVCDDAADNCPIWPGQGQRVHIGFPDPVDATGTDEEIMAVYRAVRDDIEREVLALIDGD